jgi:hypothetical protein
MYSVWKSSGLPILLAAICVVSASAAFGQSETQLRGRVWDQSGGYIAGATVTLFSDDRVRTTKSDGDGKFAFFGLSSPGRFLEVSEPGFRFASLQVGDKPPDEFSITLLVGGCPQCPVVVALSAVPAAKDPLFVQHEERSGREQLSGTVVGYPGTDVPKASLVLRKANLTGDQAIKSFTNPNRAMRERNFEYALVAEKISDENGDFQFDGLEPGWYLLEVNYANYYPEIRDFWIARETLTRPSRIEFSRPIRPSPRQPIQEAAPRPQ